MSSYKYADNGDSVPAAYVDFCLENSGGRVTAAFLVAALDDMIAAAQKQETGETQ